MPETKLSQHQRDALEFAALKANFGGRSFGSVTINSLLKHGFLEYVDLRQTLLRITEAGREALGQ